VVAPQGAAASRRRRCWKLFEGRIARYKHPKDVVFVGQLPKTALGKIRKEDVRRMVAREHSRTCQAHGAQAMALKIGIDVGGTFTDFVVTRDGEEPAIFKSCPPRPTRPSPSSKGLATSPRR
jgi:activator of 2-hydroxyglutaryl-CoA dehydratase